MYVVEVHTVLYAAQGEYNVCSPILHYDSATEH